MSKPVLTSKLSSRLTELLEAKKLADASGGKTSLAKEIAKVNGTDDGPTGMHGEAITYNEKQQEFISLAVARKSCVLNGAAGTGKTTCQAHGEG